MYFNRILPAVVATLAVLTVWGQAPAKKTTPFLPGQPVSFTENKGQVSDQDAAPRPDVLFGGNAGDLVYHIRNTGVSYQLTRTDSYREPVVTKTKKSIRVPGQKTIYRVDLNLLNSNPQPGIQPGIAFPGHSNFYLDACPQGVMQVKTYKSVVLKNIYAGIDVKYYEKDGVLKYDYLVAPQGNYRQIRLEVKGAAPKLTKTGGLAFSTPIGTVEEGAPLVVQNGKKIASRWVIEENVISFHIEAYDRSQPLVIDPPTRVWGTYIGGSGNEYEAYCAADLQGNIYVAGMSSTASGTAVATTGSHQQVYGGGTFDAYLAKFNNAGSRLWGTYYGGSGVDFAHSCAVDRSGYVFICGNTGSSTGSAIASPGSHQTLYGGGIYDAFLAKFDAATGTRQWGTYYGGTDGEYGNGCAVSRTGDVYLTGLVGATTSASVIATPGCHQPAIGGNSSDAYMAKFDASGVRQWGTYYGGIGLDKGYGCSCDTLGNVYFCGETGGSTGTLIATPGSHQPVASGINDAYLVKFDTAGTRLWATFYGGQASELGFSCATDPFDHVYLLGVTESPTDIATPGSHQTAAAIYDQRPFLVRFNSSGLRRWGTYYGGPNAGIGNIGAAWNCCTDTYGNVYFAGRCTSNASDIATAGSHQPSLVSGVEGFLVKFDSVGVRKWGTFYGGTGTDEGTSCTVDTMRNVFLAGYSTTSAGSAISTTLTHQSYQGGYESYLAKFNECGALSNTLNIKHVSCFGQVNGSATVTPGGSSGYTYTWTPTNANTPTLGGLSPGIYSISVTNSCNISLTNSLQISQPPALSLTANSSSMALCPGRPATLTASGSGGSGGLSYAWINGPSTATSLVNPTASTAYTVSLTDANGCVTSTVVSITTFSLPVISIASGSICAGSSFNLNPAGAATYTYSQGAAVVSPTMTTTYFITGSSPDGCVSAAATTGTVSVHPRPVLNLSGPGGVCAGSSATVMGTGAVSYTWNGSVVSSSFVISPVSTTVYSLTGETNLGCTGTLTGVMQAYALPNVAISGAGQICEGAQVLLTATGANSYIWNTNAVTNGIIISPPATTMYSVSGTDANGCINTASATVLVLSLPQVTISATQTLICSGNAVTLSGAGAANYFWSGGILNNTPFFPTQTGSYTLTAIGANGCQTKANTSVSVNPSPNLNVTTSHSVLCAGETAVLIANGAGQYTWSTVAQGASASISPTVSSSYTVSGTNSYGCQASITHLQIVDLCTGLAATSHEMTGILIYPNPFSNRITIVAPEKQQLSIFTALGQLLYTSMLLERTTEVDLSAYSAGVYFVAIGRTTKKILKE